VLEKHMGLRFSDQDIYINVAGGMTLKETGIDLAIAMALYSARTGISLPRETAVTGELSLAGEVRPIPHLEKRIKTARDLGFSLVVPGGVKGSRIPGAAESVRSLKQAVAGVFGKQGKESRGGD
jgi:DNA repair protein RadA/Sms